MLVDAIIFILAYLLGVIMGGLMARHMYKKTWDNLPRLGDLIVDESMSEPEYYVSVKNSNLEEVPADGKAVYLFVKRVKGSQE